MLLNSCLVRPSLEIRITVTYCASSFIGRQSQSRNCYEIINKTRVHKRAVLTSNSRTFKGF